MSNANKNCWIITGILLLTAGVFTPSLLNGFVGYDDPVYILDNAAVHSFSLKHIFTDIYAYYMPLTTLSWAIEHAIFGFNPFLFHLDNLLLHLLITTLVYFFFLRLTGRLAAATIVAVLFAIHPMHVESVAWVSERKDVLYATFFLAGLLSYLNYIERQLKKKYLILTLTWCVLSLLSKPGAIIFPAFLLLIDWYKGRKLTGRQVWVEKLPFMVASALLLFILMTEAGKAGALKDISALYSGFERICLLAYSLYYYLEKLLAPYGLCAVQLYPIKVNGLLPVVYYLAPVVVLLTAGLFLLILRNTKDSKLNKDLVFGMAIFLSGIVLYLNIVPSSDSIVAERYTYLAYLGLFFLIAQAVEWVYDRHTRFRSIIWIAAPLIIVIFSVLSFQRTKVWRNSETLHADIIKKFPDHAYGYELRAKHLHHRGEFTSALRDYNAAVTRDSENPFLYNFRALLKTDMNDYAGALSDYNAVVQLTPRQGNDLHIILNKRGLVRLTLNDLDGAMADWADAISLAPAFAESYTNLGSALYQKQAFEKALDCYNRVVKLSPDALSYFNRGNALYRLARHGEALSDFTQAVLLDSQYSEAWFNKGIAEFSLNKFQPACESWQRAGALGHLRAATALSQFCR